MEITDYEAQIFTVYLVQQASSLEKGPKKMGSNNFAENGPRTPIVPRFVTTHFDIEVIITMTFPDHSRIEKLSYMEATK
jgi:hypothetical protein